MMKIGRVIAGLVNDARESTESAREGVTRPIRGEVWPAPVPEATPTDEHRAARRQPTVQVVRRKASKTVVRAEVRAALASPAGVRRALVLHEILGPPKALRRSEDD